MHGASPDLVRHALAEHDPLPGTAGFVGEFDGRLVRDVLSRQLFSFECADSVRWSLDHRDPDDPIAVSAGCARQIVGEVAGDDEHVWSLPDLPAATDRSAALDHVHDAVSEPVWSVDDDGFVVTFSGDVDSVVVVVGIPDAPCYVAGLEGSHDVAAVREAAAAMNRDLTVAEPTHEVPERAVPEIVAVLGRMIPTDVQIVLPLYLLVERVTADGYDRLAVGQGADELFGGYAKVQKAPDDPRVETDIARGVAREVIPTLPGQLERDLLVLRTVGVDPAASLLHDRVVSATLPLPEEFLVDGDRRKVILREAVSGVLLKSVAEVDKKTVQYGTCASCELDRLAWQAGFKRRMENYVQRYVEPLVE